MYTSKEKEAEAFPEAPMKIKAKMRREKWNRKIDFLLACIGFSVGLGNVWRFPYLCYKNGGGAFLIPYFIAVFLGGIPIFFLEVVLGQYMSRGGIEAWNICPLFKGIGYAATMILFFLCCYYNVVLAWAFYYLYSSFTTVLPWAHCHNEWNSKDNCSVSGGINDTDVPYSNSSSSFTDSVIEFWEFKVLGLSKGIEDIGTVKWDLLVCLLLAWFVVFLCIMKGIKTSGKVMYVTATSPYVFMFILLIRAATLPGAKDGAMYYLVPDFSRLNDRSVWVDAGTQIFFSYSISLGTLTSLGSYNDFTHNALRDCTLFAVVNSFTSLLAGFVIFMTLGYMSKISGIPIKDVAESGPGLAFIAYPKALAKMPFAPLWSTLFFIMVILLGLDSQFVGVEGLVTALTDIFPRFMARKYHKELFTFACCVLCFLIGISMITNGGMYVFQIFDYYSGSRIILVVAFFECIVISYIYGVNRFCRDINKMFHFPFTKSVSVMWGFVSPVFVLVIFGFACNAYTQLTYTRGSTNSKYHYPTWAITAGWGLAISSVTMIPLYAIIQIVSAKGTFIERIKFLVEPQIFEDESESAMPDDAEMLSSRQIEMNHVEDPMIPTLEKS